MRLTNLVSHLKKHLQRGASKLAAMAQLIGGICQTSRSGRSALVAAGRSERLPPADEAATPAQRLVLTTSQIKKARMQSPRSVFLRQAVELLRRHRRTEVDRFLVPLSRPSNVRIYTDRPGFAEEVGIKRGAQR